MGEPHDLLQGALRRVLEAQDSLSVEEAARLMEFLLHAPVDEVRCAALLGGLAARGETAAEIAGFARALRGAAVGLPLTEDERAVLVDTCGTGGDASGTFNISTAAGLVAAAAGAKVAKHGNRAVTSACGSADVLQALGIATQATAEEAAEALRVHGFCFLLAPAHHPTLRALMPVRRAMGVRTVLHALGPLLNPAGARRQVMGVYAAGLVPRVAEAMCLLGTEHAFVVHGDGGLDELALSGPSAVAEVRDGSWREYTVTPEELGLRQAPLEAVAGGDAERNAGILRGIFAGKRGAPRDVVMLNAAAVLVTAGMAASLAEGVELAGRTIDSGAVSRLVRELKA